MIQMKHQTIGRRQFIKGIGAAAVLWQMPLWQSCKQPVVFHGVLPENQQKILHQVLNFLFPASNNSPNIEQINAELHINNYLTDPLVDPDEQKYVINGIQWLDETAQELFKTGFLSLNHTQQLTTLQNILKTSWGESWLSKLLTLTFESLLLDPLYQVNTGEIGWQWLHHQPGQPRPNAGIAYPEILNRKKEQVIITHLDQL